MNQEEKTHWTQDKILLYVKACMHQDEQRGSKTPVQGRKAQSFPVL